MTVSRKISNVLFARRTLAGAFVVAGLGIAQTAHAEIRFTNITDAALKFQIQCEGGTVDNWSIAPHTTGTLYCRNGAPAAHIRIVTGHPNGRDAVVTGQVFDGRSYSLGYDNAGDVSIEANS